MSAPKHLALEIAACKICAERFSATATGHRPRPVVWFEKGARVLIAGQAPGLQVHTKGKPFADRSGDRLRDWLGLEPSAFYDRAKVAIVPMSFCFPGYDAKGSDLPPPPICAATWRERVLLSLSDLRLTILVGGYAQKWHLGERAKGGVTSSVMAWKDLPSDIIALPHPSWRNTGWLRKNPWFEAELLPRLKERVGEALA